MKKKTIHAKKKEKKVKPLPAPNPWPPQLSPVPLEHNILASIEYPCA